MDLFEAVAEENIATITHLLKVEKVAPDQRDADGNTPLMAASLYDLIEIGRLLIEAGADPNATNNAGQTPLIQSTLYGHDNFILFLLSLRDINIDLEDNNNNNAVRYAVEIDNLPTAELLLQNGADPDSPDMDGMTLLMTVITTPNLKADPNFIPLLLQYGADVNAQDRDGLTPVMHALRKSKLLQKLLDSPALDLDIVDNANHTALMKVVSDQNTLYPISRLSMLIDAGADPFFKNSGGNTARDLASDRFILPLLQAEDNYRQRYKQAVDTLSKKFIIAGRLKETLLERKLAENIIRRAEYDNLCLYATATTPNNKPSIQALASSLNIPITTKTKTQLCHSIALKL